MRDLASRGRFCRLVDTDFAMGVFSPEPEIAVRRFGRFMNEKAEDNGIMVHGTRDEILRQIKQNLNNCR